MVAILGNTAPGNLHELSYREVWEVETVGETRMKAGVQLQKAIHL